MKKKLLTIFLILFVVFLIIAVVFFFLMKKGDPNEKGTSVSTELDIEQVLEKIEFLKLNSVEEIKQYTKDSQIYIQESDNELFFGIGELYVENVPIMMSYQLNPDKTIKRFDGSFSVDLKTGSADEVWQFINYVNETISLFYGLEYMNYSIYDKDGAPMEILMGEVQEQLLNGEAKYSFSMIDGHNTYIYASAQVADKKTINFKFFRCYDLEMYNDSNPNVDLRNTEAEDETGEG